MNQVGSPRPDLRQYRPYAALVGLALAALQASGCKREAQASDASPIVARVNGKPIPWARVAPAVETDLGRLKRHGASSPAPDLVKKVQRQRIDEAIGEELLLQESEKLPVEGLEDKVASKIAAEAATASGAPPRPADPVERRRIRDRILVDSYLERSGLADPPVPEEEVRKLFESSKESFRRPESLHAAHILVKLPANGAPQERKAAIARLRKLRAEIASGAIAFEEAARLHSGCASARRGGDLGEIRKGFMPKSFDAAAASLREGELSEVVQSEHGLHLIKVLRRTPASEPDYEAVRDLLIRHLKSNASRQVLAAHLEQLRGRAKIEIYPVNVGP